MARRSANGEGSVYKRQDGRWEAAISLLTATGKRKRLRFYGRTRQEVHGRLVAAKADADRGAPVSDSQPTLSEYVDYWLEHIVRPDLRPKTYQQYEYVSRLYIKPTLGGVRLAQLSVPKVQAFINHEFQEAESQGRSRRSVHAVRAVLSAALSSAMREELVTRNVARLVKLQPHTRARITPWTLKEATQFLHAARTHPLFPAFALVLLYGLRQGEILGLRWQDIHFESDEIQIRQQVQRVGRRLLVGPVKTTAGERDLPLIPWARELLQQQRRAQHALDGAPSLVFISDDGGPLRPERFRRSFLRLCDSGAVRKVKIHHERHTTATLLKKLGVPDRDIQTILGHSRVSVTQEIYQHTDLEDRRAALELLSSSLNPAQGRVYCRQSCRQTPRIHVAATAAARLHAVLTGVNSGAGRGSRTPEGVSRLIYSQMRLTTSLSQHDIHLEPTEGFEPTTRCLQNSRSTTELHRHNYWLIIPSRLCFLKKIDNPATYILALQN